VRAEEKEVDGREIDRDQRLRESELETADEEEVPERIEDEARDLRGADRTHLLDAVRAIVERRTLVVNDLALPKHEKRALEALKAAVDGRDAQLNQFVYAADRREMLEQALAVLQPSFVYDHHGLADVIHRVGELRGRLSSLGDAQDELMDANKDVGITKADGDKDDKPEPTEGEEQPSTLSTGPEVKIAAKPPSMLTSGPELAPARKPPSTLGSAADPDPESEPEPESESDPESDPKSDADVAKKKPWWRRPFG
jgi:hypothetical protein